MTAVPPVELLELGEDYLMEELDALVLLSSAQSPKAVEVNLDVSAEACGSVGSTADQSRVFDALSSLPTGLEANAPRELFQPSASPHHQWTTRQLSRQTPAIPEMLSLKEVCRQLKVGRHTIMQLIRRRDLRYYRIVHRYRLAVEDIKKYLERASTT